jgi:heme oxygenase
MSALTGNGHNSKMIREALKARTQPYHDRLEAMLDVMRRPLTKKEYTDLLVRFYGFYLPMETLLAHILSVETASLDFTPRRKSSLLERDLLALGVTIEEIRSLPRCPCVPVLADPTEALGCMYVLEGATLGGQVISRRIRQLLGFSATSGCAFFSSYGDEVGPMWNAFVSALTAHATTPERIDAMGKAACETFAAIEQWMRE